MSKPQRKPVEDIRPDTEITAFSRYINGYFGNHATILGFKLATAGYLLVAIDCVFAVMCFDESNKIALGMDSSDALQELTLYMKWVAPFACGLKIFGISVSQLLGMRIVGIMHCIQVLAICAANWINKPNILRICFRMNFLVKIVLFPLLYLSMDQMPHAWSLLTIFVVCRVAYEYSILHILWSYQRVVSYGGKGYEGKSADDIRRDVDPNPTETLRYNTTV